MNTIAGVGPDAPLETKENGAKQSAVPYRFDLIDAAALADLAAVLKRGAEKYGVDNWRGLSVEDHLNHLVLHTYSHLAGDEQDRHLSNVFARAMMALAVAIEHGYEVIE